LEPLSSSKAKPDTIKSGTPKPFCEVFDHKIISPRPIWLMRQAGRYLPEYREIRATAASFLEFCYTPRLAAEASLQPITRFGFDAAILFSDILVVPDALGQKVSFESGEGPKLEALETAEQIAKLHKEIDLEKLAPVFETIDRVKSALPAETALIGFCGAPWTVASYMIAGKGTADQAPARLLAYRQRDLFQKLINLLVEASIDYLSAQIKAGVEAVQIFDSWAGTLPPAEFDSWVLAPIKAIVAGLREKHPDARIIAFPRGAGSQLTSFAALCGADALGLDTAVEPIWAARVIDQKTILQGNLDPLALVAGGKALENATRDIIEAFRGRPHIFNLGHGILPETPIAHVEHLLKILRTEG
jgi:uroporphyrinogen decarboxylase